MTVTQSIKVLEFKPFKQLFQLNFAEVIKEQTYLFQVNIDKYTLWDTYLNSFSINWNKGCHLSSPAYHRRSNYMTTTVKRSTAIWRIKYWLEENKTALVPVDNQPKVLVSVLEKLDIQTEPTELLAYLTEEEYQSLFNNVEILNNIQLSELLYKFMNVGYSDYGKERYEVYNDDSNVKFDLGI